MSRSRSRSPLPPPRRRSRSRERDDRDHSDHRREQDRGGADRGHRDRDRHRPRRDRDERDDRRPRRRSSRSRSPTTRRRSPSPPSKSTSFSSRSERQAVPFGERSQRPAAAVAPVVKDARTVEEEKKAEQLARINELLTKVREKEERAEKAEAEGAAGAEQKGLGVDDDVAVQEGGGSEEAELMRLMGLPLSGFDSTKGKLVKDGNVSGVKLTTQRKHRQYMNKKGGFNRPPATAQ